MANESFRVTHYKLNWNLEISLGSIQLIQSTGVQAENVELTGLRHQDYLILVDMLRNEKPVYYDKQSQELFTGTEMTGEEEG